MDLPLNVDLKDKVIVVTGAGGVLCSMFAKAIAKTGAKVALLDRNLEAANQYAEEISKLYKEATGKDIQPTDLDILKYQLWEEQGHICLYTGKKIGIADFIGAGPMFDIEHTIPQSVGGDSTQENMTLCSSHYNRYVKKAKLPTELAEYESIMTRIEPWKEHFEEISFYC